MRNLKKRIIARFGLGCWFCCRNKWCPYIELYQKTCNVWRDPTAQSPTYE